MKTHELAQTLQSLARFLRSVPNVELDDLRDVLVSGSGKELRLFQDEIDLSHFMALSRINKRKWLDLIEAYNFPIEVRTRDSSRDILGKLLRYLERTPEARNQLRRSSPSEARKASPELLKALSSLLKE
jgi:hypothetical protein